MWINGSQIKTKKPGSFSLPGVVRHVGLCSQRAGGSRQFLHLAAAEVNGEVQRRLGLHHFATDRGARCNFRLAASFGDFEFRADTRYCVDSGEVTFVVVLEVFPAVRAELHLAFSVLALLDKRLNESFSVCYVHPLADYYEFVGHVRVCCLRLFIRCIASS